MRVRREGLFLLGAIYVWAAAALNAPLAHGSAFPIPDHDFRLGSCGSAGPACDWTCGSGPSCGAPAETCRLDGPQSFHGVLYVKIDEDLCGDDEGAVVTLGLAGTKPDGNTFQLADKVIDLCDRPIPCSGRAQRACPCGEENDASCLSPGGCPPGDVVFFCKDPCFTADAFMRESDLTGDNFRATLNQTHQPLLQLFRDELAAQFPTAGGHAVVVGGSHAAPTSGDPPESHFCIAVTFLRDDKPLGVCSTDAAISCADDGPCLGGTCLAGTPPGVNPSVFTDVVSGRICDGGDRPGLPCVDETDCPVGGTCEPAGTSVDPAACSTTSVCSEAQPGISCDADQDACTYDTCDFSGQCVPQGAITACADRDRCCPDGCTSQNDSDCSACAASPLEGCIEADRARLLMHERRAGREKMTLRLGKLSEATTLGDLGDPIAGSTRYDVCIYDETDVLVGELVVDRAGQQCDGSHPQPCWRTVDPQGYRYRDPDASASGVKKIVARPAGAGAGKIVVSGRNHELRGHADLPSGVASALASNAQATVQVVTSDASCVGATFTEVKIADGTTFRAGKP